MTGGAPREDVRRRLATAVVLVPLFLLAVALGGVFFMVAIVGLSAVGAWEFMTMAGVKGFRPRVVFGVGLAMAFPAALEVSTRAPMILPALLVVGIFGVAVAHLLDPDGDEAIASVAATVFGAAWVGLFFGHMILLREIPRAIPGMPGWFGALFVLAPILLTWANDTAAYFVGHRWGRRKLLPRVSPGKSVEGALGGLIATVVLAFPILMAVNAWVRLFGPLDMLAIGLLVGLVAPCGDLIESAFKRDAGVKDTSDLIPGHGGVLDRFDSLLVTATVFYYYVRWVVL